jgi:hypothetical protein
VAFREEGPKSEAPSTPQPEPPASSRPADLSTLIEQGRHIKARSRELLTRLLDLFRELPKQ